MTQIIAYLKFKENARVAMTHYQKCFGGELKFQTLEGSVFDSPNASEADREKILHSQLVSDRIVLFASEMMVPDSHPNSTFLWVNCSIDEEIRQIHAGLAEGGTITGDLQTAYWGTTFGAITDAYGIQWYISKLPL